MWNVQHSRHDVLKCDYRNGRSPSDGYELVDYMNAEFGDVAVEQVHKGKDLDQKLVGILISDWIAHHGRGRVRLVARNTETDRSVSSSLNVYL